MKTSVIYLLMLLLLTGAAGCNRPGKDESKKIIKVPSDAPDLGTAVSQAGDGTIIILSPGTYKENNIDITRAITITSEWRDSGDETKIDQTIIDAQDQILFNIRTPGAEISGLRIIKGDHTLNITASTTVKYCHFDDNLDALSFESGSGGYAGYNVITNDRDDGMDMDIGSKKDNIGSDIVVEYNSITSSNDDGIEIRLYEAADQNTKYEIHNNVISGSNNAGIQLISYDVYTGKVFEIHHNIIRNCKTGLGCMEGSNTREDLSGATKMDEIVWLYNNTLINNQMGATGGNRIIAFNNIVKDNALGGFKKFGSSSEVRNNLFFGNGGADLIETAVKDEGSIFSDPMIDLKSFALMTGSPCIDAGISELSSGRWKIQVTGISGKGPDLGAIESETTY